MNLTQSALPPAARSLAAGCLILVAAIPGVSAASGDLEAWLDKTPVLKDRLLWISGDGKHHKFDDWTAGQKQRLDLFYGRLAAGARDLGMRGPSPGLVDLSSGRAYFTTDQAFDLYAASVAHVLWVENRHLVPWSIQARSVPELDMLLASSGYCARIKPAPNNEYPSSIRAGRDFIELPEHDQLGDLNGDPRIGFDFLTGKTSATRRNLVANSELQTLINITAWFRDNLDHGPIDDKRNERSGRQRFLDQRLRAPSGEHLAIAVNGCHSAAKLFVDLARSVNIPILYATALDNMNGNGSGNYFNHTHAGLVYGWAGPKPRILWHADDIYATPGRICFPLDPATGTLATPEQADRQYFDERWVTPAAIRKAGFDYRLQRVIPGQGYAHHSRGKSEDRFDYGTCMGSWKKSGESRLDDLLQLSHDCVLCGKPVLEDAVRGIKPGQSDDSRIRELLTRRLDYLIKLDLGDFTEEQVPLARTVRDSADHIIACIKALGGPEKINEIIAESKARRGNNLLVPKSTAPSHDADGRSPENPKLRR